MNNVYQFNYLNCLVSVYHNGNVENTIKVDTLKNQMLEIYTNVYKYMGNIWDNVKLEIWDKNRLDIPKNTYNCNGTTCSVASYGIGSYGGLTWASNKLIQINTVVINNDIDLANVLSHEVGHWLDHLEDSSIDSKMQKLWEQIRGKDATLDTPKSELIAEDHRLLFGSSGAKGNRRTDKYNYKQATEVQGLESFYLLWKPVNDFIKSLNNLLGVDLTIEYNPLNFSDCNIIVNVRTGLQMNTLKYKFTRSGIYFESEFLFFKYYSLVRNF